MKEMQARLLGRKVAQQRIKYHVPHYDDHDSSGPTIDEIK